jgi:hypothetical protein
VVCNECKHRHRRLFGSKEDGEPEAVGISAIFGAERVVPHHLPFFGSGFGEGEPLRLGEQFSSRHPCPY